MQIKNRQQLLVVIAVSAIALFAGDKIIFSPLMGLWDGRQKEIAGLRAKIGQGKQLLSVELPIRAHWRDLLQRSLTNDTSAAEQRVLQALNQWAQDSGAIITGINPQWKFDSDEYCTYECHVDATGDINRLNRFLFAAEREPLALRFQSAEFTARDKEGNQLALVLQFSALMLTPTAR